MSDETLLETNPTSLSIIVTDEISNDELAIEDHKSGINDYLIGLIARTSNRLKDITTAGRNHLVVTHSPDISVILKNKTYANVRHLVVPTMPGFTGSYKSLSSDLEQYQILDSAERSVRAVITYFEKLLSNPELFKTQTVKLLLTPSWKATEWKKCRAQLSTHYQTHDNRSNRVFGEVFANLSEFDQANHRAQALMTSVSSASLGRLVKLVDQLDTIAQKCFMQYISKPDFVISSGVRTQAAAALRECASVVETVAFYSHILTQTVVSLNNIKEHLSKKL